MNGFRGTIIEVIEKKVLYTSHAVHQMSKPGRMISKDEVREVLKHGEIIEDYPEDRRGHSCLMAGETTLKRIVHVVCSPKSNYLAVITAYIPNEDEWENDFEQRKKEAR